MGKKDKQNAAESTPEKNTAQQPTADEAAKTAETAYESKQEVEAGMGILPG